MRGRSRRKVSLRGGLGFVFHIYDGKRGCHCMNRCRDWSQAQ